ncbi:unnamed protein product [Acanthosepion pharaonis]|uniref:Uncharacterized protein n=1 Tax=Acanthosepion pharaonis TaxID=158019 RepID=A0A812DPM3_ACAPH|nr:unnamed protein product [Sepia pharaonis]
MQPWATLFSRVGSHRRCSPTLFVSPRAISNMAYLSTATAGNMWPLLPTVFYHMGTLASETLHFQISPLQSSLLLFCNLRLSAASPCGSYCLLHVLLLLVNTLASSIKPYHPVILLTLLAYTSIDSPLHTILLNLAYATNGPSVNGSFNLSSICCSSSVISRVSPSR